MHASLLLPSDSLKQIKKAFGKNVFFLGSFIFFRLSFLFFSVTDMPDCKVLVFFFYTGRNDVWFGTIGKQKDDLLNVTDAKM